MHAIERLILKVERAKKHIVDLESEWTAFFHDGGYVISSNDNLETRERTYYLETAKEMPNISLIAGDAIHNLRASLDHLAYHLVAIGTSGRGPFSRIYFPISRDADEYKANSARKIEGMRDDAKDAIAAIEPYGRGAGEILWQLHCLNNIDKHRFILTVYTDFLFHSLLPSQRHHFEQIYIGSHPGEAPPDLRGVVIAPTAKRFPLKQGDKLLTIPECEIEQYMKLTLGIAFGEPEVVKGKPVIETLNGMADFIRNRIIVPFGSLGLLD